MQLVAAGHISSSEAPGKPPVASLTWLSAFRASRLLQEGAEGALLEVCCTKKLEG